MIHKILKGFGLLFGLVIVIYLGLVGIALFYENIKYKQERKKMRRTFI